MEGKIILNIILFFLVIISLFSFFDSIAIVCLLIITELAISFLRISEERTIFNRIIQISLLICGTVGCAYLILRNYNILTTFSILSYIISIILIFTDFINISKKWKDISKKKKIISFIPISLLLIFVIISFLLLRVFLYRDDELIKYRNPMSGNITDDISGENKTYTWEQNYIRKANEKYISSYPNNEFDIYYNKKHLVN